MAPLPSWGLSWSLLVPRSPGGHESRGLVLQPCIHPPRVTATGFGACPPCHLLAIMYAVTGTRSPSAPLSPWPGCSSFRKGLGWPGPGSAEDMRKFPAPDQLQRPHGACCCCPNTARPRRVMYVRGSASRGEVLAPVPASGGTYSTRCRVDTRKPPVSLRRAWSAEALAPCDSFLLGFSAFLNPLFSVQSALFLPQILLLCL